MSVLTGGGKDLTTLSQFGGPKSRFNHISLGWSSKKRKCVFYIIVLSRWVFSSQKSKDTPLTEAIRNGHTDIVKMLIENGADVSREGKVR